MRKAVTAAVLVALAAAFAWAEANPQPSPVNVVLIEAQLQQLSAARGDATLTLTRGQLDAIKKTFPKLTATTVKANLAQVRNGNELAIIVDARGEANPQPSP
jgi:hypothetical protein